MGERRENNAPVWLFFGLLVREAPLFDTVIVRLEKDFAPVAVRSAVLPFDQSAYYEPEMGPGLLRQWVAMRDPMRIVELPDFKIHTNRLEKYWADESGARRVNIDPGYVTDAKVVLATTKDHMHRLYVDSGIYEEVTLHYKRGEGYAPWPWTYPDYQTDAAREFFTKVRALPRANDTEQVT